MKAVGTPPLSLDALFHNPICSLGGVQLHRPVCFQLLRPNSIMAACLSLSHFLTALKRCVAVKANLVLTSRSGHSDFRLKRPHWSSHGYFPSDGSITTWALKCSLAAIPSAWLATGFGTFFCLINTAFIFEQHTSSSEAWHIPGIFLLGSKPTGPGCCCYNDDSSSQAKFRSSDVLECAEEREGRDRKPGPFRGSSKFGCFELSTCFAGVVPGTYT